MSTPTGPTEPASPSAGDARAAEFLKLVFMALVAAAWAGMLGGAYFAEVTRRRFNAPPPKFIENPLERVEAKQQAEADAKELEFQLDVQSEIFRRNAQPLPEPSTGPAGADAAVEPAAAAEPAEAASGGDAVLPPSE